jgi:hypothetical protein
VTGEFTKSDISKGRRILSSDMLSESGRNWLIRALDPFHDSPVRPAGYPDMDQSYSVVQEINESMTISAPASVTSGTWDCHIMNLPDFASVVGNSGNLPATYNPLTGQFSIITGVSTYSDCGVVALSVPSGALTYPDSNAQVGANITTQNLQPNIYINGKCRVVGWAFEVVNTTAELYLQGLCTAYRMPQVDQLTTYTAQDETSTSTIYTPAPLRVFAMPPSSVAEALVLPGSKQWDAKRGYYGVCLLSTTDNPFQAIDSSRRAYLTNEIWASTSSPPLNCVVSYRSKGGIGNSGTCKYFAPYNTTGAYFTGLSLQTTLQVNVKWILETAPGPRSTFATLAQPSPAYDPVALELYSEMVQHLPVGVPFDENPDGEWFENVLGTLGTLSTMASGVHPMFGLIGKGLDIARRIAPEVYKLIKRNEEKKENSSQSQSNVISKPAQPALKVAKAKVVQSKTTRR